jgi:hypothetical protein
LPSWQCREREKAGGFQRAVSAKRFVRKIVIRTLLGKFWQWYERHYVFNLGLSAFLFVLQLIHLYWLTTDVVVFRLFGESHFHPVGVLKVLILVVDYTEIPALISTSLIYINGLRKRFNYKDSLFLFFINSQWLHIFWITDEFVLTEFGRSGLAIPVFLAWIAIGIDYLELPVIYDTIRRLVVEIRKGVKGKLSIKQIAENAREDRGKHSAK